MISSSFGFKAPGTSVLRYSWCLLPYEYKRLLSLNSSNLFPRCSSVFKWKGIFFDPDGNLSFDFSILFWFPLPFIFLPEYYSFSFLWKGRIGLSAKDWIGKSGDGSRISISLSVLCLKINFLIRSSSYSIVSFPLPKILFDVPSPFLSMLLGNESSPFLFDGLMLLLGERLLLIFGSISMFLIGLENLFGSVTSFFLFFREVTIVTWYGSSSFSIDNLWSCSRASSLGILKSFLGLVIIFFV